MILILNKEEMIMYKNMVLNKIDEFLNKEGFNLINRLTSFFNTDALPFFEKWKDLNVLYEYIKNKTEREELSEILGQFWQFKKAVILRLCNDTSYQDFMTKFVNRREEILKMRPESIDVQRYYNASKELKQVLDNTEPIYNV